MVESSKKPEFTSSEEKIIVLDIGSRMVKTGFAGEDAP
jgi:actin-related protein